MARSGHFRSGFEEPVARFVDVDRRDRIIDSALEVIAEVGVAGTSHRKVAAAAGVPLGSMTYHFSGMDELLREAFGRFADVGCADFERRMAAATDSGQARTAVREYITGHGEEPAARHRSLVLTHELYTLAAREPAFRAITNGWMARSRRALEQHFDPVTARIVDALIEGLSIHRALDTEAGDDAAVALALERAVGSGGPDTHGPDTHGPDTSGPGTSGIG